MLTRCLVVTGLLSSVACGSHESASGADLVGSAERSRGPDETSSDSPTVPDVVGPEHVCQEEFVGKSTDQPPTLHANNGVEFDGLMLGKGLVTNDQLRRSVAARVTTGDSEYELGQAYLLRPDPSDTDFFWYYVPVTRTAAGLRCFIKSEPTTLHDAAGSTIGRERDYVQGRIAGEFVWTDTCLDAGETGYILGLVHETSDFRQVRELVLNLDDQSVGGNGRNASRLATITDICKSRRGVTAVASLTSAQPARIQQLSRYVLFDTGGIPVISGFLERLLPISNETSLAQGETAVLADSRVRSDGQGSKLRVFLNYDNMTFEGSVDPRLQALAGRPDRLVDDVLRYREKQTARWKAAVWR